MAVPPTIAVSAEPTDSSLTACLWLSRPGVHWSHHWLPTICGAAESRAVYWRAWPQVTSAQTSDFPGSSRQRQRDAYLTGASPVLVKGMLERNPNEHIVS
jgi:hypothetical protein